MDKDKKDKKPAKVKDKAKSKKGFVRLLDEDLEPVIGGNPAGEGCARNCD